MTTISDTFRKFLNEQEVSLKSETFLDCEEVILLYEEFLEFSAEDSLSDEDLDLYTVHHKRGKSYCDIFGPERLTPSGIKEFLEDYVVEVGGGKKFVGTAAKVLDKFFEWTLDEGFIEEKAFEANNEILSKYKKR